ncbi:hypothetical protein BH09MYX1_BH09MYX1_47600 [soil metagenome]
MCVTDHVKLEFLDLKGQLVFALDDPLCHQTNLNEHLKCVVPRLPRTVMKSWRRRPSTQESRTRARSDENHRQG